MFEIALLSGFKVFPRAGGLDDQDPLFIDDFRLVMRLYHFQKQKYPDKLQGFFDAEAT